ncbi:MAG: response regulator [Lachnospiraceae bacterium]|nr:response regulator [Lachnospiraceae bacterium]
MKSRRHIPVIIFVSLMLLIVTSMNTWMVFRQTRQQTRDTGIYQLEMISGELERTISQAGDLTMELAMAAREYLDDEQALEAFMYERKAELVAGSSGAFNMYIAGTGFSVFPDFDMPDDYIPTERVWYIGAKKTPGRTYVSPPYQDAMTGDICYTVSVMLGDGDAVLGVDYTMETIQAHIEQMYQNGSHNAVIVTAEGIIAGCSDQSLIGTKLTSTLPDYTAIWSLARNTDDVATSRIKADHLYDNLFATKSGNGWYLIISESDWDMYSGSYTQLVVTITLSVMLFAIVIILYVQAVRSRKSAEDALASRDEFLSGITAELKQPLIRILNSSSADNTDSIYDYRAELARIHAAGERLSEMIEQIVSYSSIVRKDAVQDKQGTGRRRTSHKRFRAVILMILVTVMIISLYISVTTTYRWGNELMRGEAEQYEFELSEWIDSQKSILDMFVSAISVNPAILNDYDQTIDYLNRITQQYPNISVTYMASPELEPSVYMNNGWTPEPGWKVEERQWYIDTVSSASGWNISAPYYDEQTGAYCVTLSETVYDAETGRFLGCFGIDFFMDKLVDILGGSYSDQGYAFLVDTDGDIINHPYGSYQMSVDSQTNISSLPYGEIKADGHSTKAIRDYDGTLRIISALRNDESQFVVYVASSMWMIYGRMIIYTVIVFVAFSACIAMVYSLLSYLIRSQDEANVNMRNAADAAIAAGQAKSRFLAQMSHEIRTPINAVLGMNEMILRETGDENIREYAGNIQAAGANLLSLINSILDFSKIEDGKMEIIPVRYDLATVVNNLVNSIAQRAKDKSLELSVNVDEGLPTVLYGDDLRISQVVMNLLTNAVKYTDRGSVSLNVSEDRRENNSVYITFKVSDTGIGIREEDMDKLFGSFERIEETRNRNIEGTGLGMSIVTRLLDMMDSSLNVESVYGEGSEFSFVIRQDIVDPHPVGDYRKRLGITEYTGSRTHPYVTGAKVLVVDDNEMNLKVAAGLLKLNGIKPNLAFSGAEAIERMKETPYDLVFLDHMMPEMDGMETLKILKENDLIPKGCAVIALTANAVVGARDLYLNAGFSDYLSKPIDVERLEDKLIKFLPAEMIEMRSADTGEDGGDDDIEILEFAPGEGLDQAEEPSEEGYDIDTIISRAMHSSLDVSAGIEYCGGDRGLYAELLSDYAGEYEDRRTRLGEYLKSANVKKYQILVHSLKSTSLTIGAEEMYADAKRMEEAAAAGDIPYMDAHHDELMSRYAAQVLEVSEIVGANSTQ